MPDFIKWLRSFKPPLILPCVLTFLLGAASVFIAATDFGERISPVIVYVFYAGAAVCLSLSVWSIVLSCKHSSPWRQFLELAHRSKITGQFIDDFSFRTVTFTYGSLAVNIILTLAKGVAGWLSASWWLITLSAYYLILCAARFLLLNESRKIVKIESESQRRLHQWKAYRVCGGLLMSMTGILFGVVILIMKQENAFTYYGTLIFAVALWDFYCLTSSIIYMVRNRKQHSPIIVALKTIKLAAALVSMLSLQTEMLVSFGTGGAAQSQMNLATGSAVSLALLAIGLAMVIKSNKTIKALRQTEVL